MTVSLTARFAKVTGAPGKREELGAKTASSHTIPDGRTLLVRVPLVRYRLTGVGRQEIDGLTGNLVSRIIRQPVDKAEPAEGYLYIFVTPRIIILEEEEVTPK